MLLIACSCQKENLSIQKKLNSASEDELLTKTGDNAYTARWLVKIQTEEFYIYKRSGNIAKLPTENLTETQSIGYVQRQLNVFDSVKQATRTSFSNTKWSITQIFSDTAVYKMTSYSVANSQDDAHDGDPDPAPATTYQYHYTLYYDYTWPAINYKVTVWYNVVNGQITEAMVTTGIWGSGIYQSYAQVTQPPPYIHIDNVNHTIYWDAFGDVTLGVNIPILNIYSATITMEYEGIIQFYTDGLGRSLPENVRRLYHKWVPNPSTKH